MIKVLLVDDHEMVRIGVSAYLSVQDDMEVVGEAENGREGADMALELRPDIILMDLVMDEMDGIEATKEIMQNWKEAKSLLLQVLLMMKKYTRHLKLERAVICLKLRQRAKLQMRFELHTAETLSLNQK